jgi:hypothetical protein
MGTSLADRAWGRDSAAYRVAGVLSVLSGWFLTAAVAFTLAGLFAVLLSVFGATALGVLVVLVVLALVHSFRYHGQREAREARARSLEASAFDHQVALLQSQMSELLGECSETVELAIEGLIRGDRAQLDRALQQVDELKASAGRKELVFVRVLKRVRPGFNSHLLEHLETLACQQDLFQSTQTIVDTARTHVLNSHERPSESTAELLRRFDARQREITATYAASWGSLRPPGPEEEHLEDLMELLRRCTASAVADLYDNVRPVKNSTLMLTLLTELADYVREMYRAQRLWGSARLAEMQLLEAGIRLTETTERKPPTRPRSI